MSQNYPVLALMNAHSVPDNFWKLSLYTQFSMLHTFLSQHFFYSGYHIILFSVTELCDLEMVYNGILRFIFNILKYFKCTKNSESSSV